MREAPFVVSIILGAVIVFGIVPSFTVWGWVRFARRREERTVPSLLSTVALSLATASILCAVLYLLLLRSVPADDLGPDPPRIEAVIQVGAAFDLIAVVTALAGTRKPNRIRWQSLVVAVGVLLFWISQGFRIH